jgi:hypothetical protein
MNFNDMKVSTRLNLMIGVAVLVMLALAAVNWVGLSHLGALQDAAYQRSKDAAQIRHDSGLGAQWQAMSGEIDTALDFAAKVADTDQERQWAQEARKAMGELRTLYAQSYLPMAQRDAPLSEIGVVDAQIDKLIDKYDEFLHKGANSLQAEADAADVAFDVAATTTRTITVARYCWWGWHS